MTTDGIDFVLLDVQLLWISASEHLSEALKTGSDNRWNDIPEKVTPRP